MRRAGAAGNIKLNMKGVLLFQWSSILDNVSRSGIWSNQTFVFEIIMVLAHYGLLHSNVARNQASVGDHVNASKTLKQGAGILKFVCSELLPKWQSRPEKVKSEIMEALQMEIVATEVIFDVEYLFSSFFSTLILLKI